jgi:hypothetical protein
MRRDVFFGHELPELPRMRRDVFFGHELPELPRMRRDVFFSHELRELTQIKISVNSSNSWLKKVSFVATPNQPAPKVRFYCLPYRVYVQICHTRRSQFRREWSRPRFLVAPRGTPSSPHGN